MVKGSKHSEKAKRKMTEAKKGKHYSPETEFRKGHIPWIKGKGHSEETKRKISKTWFKKGCISWNKGKTMPEETKKKLSEANKGKHFSLKTEFKKGQNIGSKNPAKKLEIRIKISQAKKGKPLFNLRGENHGNWKGGITPKNEKIRKSIEYKLWRGAVFDRDNWACQKCRKKGVGINVHHVYNFADFSGSQKSIENGITLCKKCHMEFHKIYGRNNNTKEGLEEFLTLSAGSSPAKARGCVAALQR